MARVLETQFLEFSHLINLDRIDALAIDNMGL